MRSGILDDGCNGSKRLLLSTDHVRADLGDDSRLKETATKLMASSTAHDLSTLRHRIFHVLFHLCQQPYRTYCTFRISAAILWRIYINIIAVI